MLGDLLKTLLATTYAYSIKAQLFHWNVEGSDFAQLHAFFSDIYDDANGAIDPMAEYIRSLGEYAPGSLERFQELSKIPGQLKIPRARLMLEELLANTEVMIALLNECFSAASTENKQAIANFIAERLSAHEKYQWQLRSFLKEARG